MIGSAMEFEWGIIHLRCTISGGLEDLATNELHKIFPHCCLEWTQRGNSGSQLSLQIPKVLWSIDALVQAMQQLRFVEYAYHVVHGQDYEYASSDDDGPNARHFDQSGPTTLVANSTEH